MTPSFTIMVVDDEENIVRLVQEILQESGFQVIAGCSGEDALYVNEKYPFPIHLLLTDIRMSSTMDGLDLAGALRALRPEMKVLYMSGFTNDPRLASQLEEGSSEFISKPFTPTDLIRKVNAILNSEDALSRP